ncbi:hypothetical protein GCM10027347_00700 [Larkinella harenae]
MKTATIWLLCAFLSLTAFAPAFVDRTSFSVKDSDSFYEVSARYDPDKTGKVQSCLDDHLRQRGSMSFRNTELDATMSLDDKTIFYIQSSPGKLFLKLDKRKNSDKAYAKFKKLGKELGDILTKS